MLNSTQNKINFLFLFILLFTGCSSEESNPTRTDFGIFSVVNETTIEMDGVINSSSLRNFNALIENYPEVNLINIFEVDGSDDDDINLLLSKRVHDLNISTQLVDNGLIASGGVDFFLAGVRRTKGTNTLIGVHSWSDGVNEATDFPVGDVNHLPYIDYYTSVGFSQQEAEDFYYFTINAAPAADIHWMTESEISEYGILKP